LLDRGDGGLGLFGCAKGDQNLIENNLIENCKTGSAESLTEAAGLDGNCARSFPPNRDAQANEVQRTPG